MTFDSVTELRTLVKTTLTGVTVIANQDIFAENIESTIRNNGIGVFTIQVSPQDAGKLYIVKKDGSEEYLTDPNVDWPAKLVIIVTYFLAADDSFNIRYTSDTTFSSVIITMGGGVY